MRRFILSLAAGLVLCSAATAQDIGGNYTVEGTNLDGSAYGGTAEIKLTIGTTCEIYWTTVTTTTQGICMRNDNAFSAAYVLGDAIGLIIYLVQEDGSMQGLWTIAGKEGNGTEALTPAQ